MAWTPIGVGIGGGGAGQVAPVIHPLQGGTHAGLRGAKPYIRSVGSGLSELILSGAGDHRQIAAHGLGGAAGRAPAGRGARAEEIGRGRSPAAGAVAAGAVDVGAILIGPLAVIHEPRAAIHGGTIHVGHITGGDGGCGAIDLALIDELGQGCCALVDHAVAIFHALLARIVQRRGVIVGSAGGGVASCGDAAIGGAAVTKAAHGLVGAGERRGVGEAGGAGDVIEGRAAGGWRREAGQLAGGQHQEVVDAIGAGVGIQRAAKAQLQAGDPHRHIDHHVIGLLSHAGIAIVVAVIGPGQDGVAIVIRAIVVAKFARRGGTVGDS